MFSFYEAPQDYMEIDQVVAFTNEDTTQCGVIQVVNDMVLEIDEQLFVTVISSDSSAQVPTTPASVIIQDDDSKWANFFMFLPAAQAMLFRYLGVTANLNQNAYTVVEGMMAVSVCVSLSGTIERNVIVTLTTSSDSTLGIYTEWLCFISILSLLHFYHNKAMDFTPVDRVITFQSNASICEDVTIIDDSVLENAETFQIALSTSDPDVNLGNNATASITILDDDSKNSTI